MCGILGVTPPDNISIDALHHRGPDGSQTVTHKRVTFAQSRLSILDLSERGTQPKWSEDHKVLLTYNGEIYNYKSFSNSSESSDTAALVEWLARNGTGFRPEKLDGMYAFGAYFADSDTLILCRDPVGIKPLYIAVNDSGECLAFSSEIKGFFGVPWFNPLPNEKESVQRDFVQFGYCLPQTVELNYRGSKSALKLIPTLIKGVFQLPPGTKFSINSQGKVSSERFTVDSSVGEPISLLQQSVKAQAMSDVEVGIQLSGGIDSSLVGYEYAKITDKLHGFYVSVDADGLNEDRWVEMASDKISKVTNFELHKLVLNQSEINRLFIPTVFALDEPMVRHPNAMGINLLSEHVKKNTKVKVLLTGEGADEIFGGYEWHQNESAEGFAQSRKLIDIGPSTEMQALWERSAGQTNLQRKLSFDRAAYLPPILARQDRISMAHSIESRVPFLANSFWGLPYPSSAGKVELKQYAAQIFGEEFAYRQKSGFGLSWDWLTSFYSKDLPLEWLKFKFDPKTAPEQWALSAIGHWAQLYLFGGWKDYLTIKPKTVMKEIDYSLTIEALSDSVEELSEEVSQIKTYFNPVTGKPHLPRFEAIRVETTNMCNLRCEMCPQSTAAKGIGRGHMKRELFEKIVDEVSRFPENRNALFYLHVCGEPLLHRKEIFHFIEYASAAGLQTVLTTNATTLDEECAEKVIRAGLRKIEISFEGMSKEIYESYRVRSNYERTFKNILGFLNLNRKLGGPVKTELVVVDLPKIPDEAKRFFMETMKPHFDTVNLSGYFDWLGEVEGPKFNRGRYLGCNAMDISMNVLWDGTVVPCCMDVYGEMPVGNFNTMTYEQVLSANNRIELQHKIDCGKIEGLPCDKCAVPFAARKDNVILTNDKLPIIN